MCPKEFAGMANLVDLATICLEALSPEPSCPSPSTPPILPAVDAPPVLPAAAAPQGLPADTPPVLPPPVVAPQGLPAYTAVARPQGRRHRRLSSLLPTLPSRGLLLVGSVGTAAGCRRLDRWLHLCRHRWVRDCFTAAFPFLKTRTHKDSSFSRYRHMIPVQIWLC